MYDPKQQTYTKTEYDIVRDENEDLCDNVDAARQDLADYLAGTLEGKLKDENTRLREKLAQWTYLLPLIEAAMADMNVLITGIIKDNGGADSSSYSDVVFKRQVANIINELQALKGE